MEDFRGMFGESGGRGQWSALDIAITKSYVASFLAICTTSKTCLPARRLAQLRTAIERTPACSERRSHVLRPLLTTLDPSVSQPISQCRHTPCHQPNISKHPNVHGHRAMRRFDPVLESPNTRSDVMQHRDDHNRPGIRLLDPYGSRFRQS